MAQNKLRILIVDDDIELCAGLSGALAPYYDCEWISESSKAVAHIEARRPHLVLLDYQMPLVKGTEICTQLKATRSLKNIPVIFISGVATIDEKIRAFECGANDFIPKPFHFREFLLRIRARLSPPSGRNPQDLVAGNLRLSELTRRAYIDHQEVFLTQLQFEILKVFILRPKELITRRECMELVWGKVDLESRKLDSHISLLKGKLKAFKGKIVPVPGQGYLLEVWDEG